MLVCYLFLGLPSCLAAFSIIGTEVHAARCPLLGKDCRIERNLVIVTFNLGITFQFFSSSITTMSASWVICVTVISRLDQSIAYILKALVYMPSVYQTQGLANQIYCRSLRVFIGKVSVPSQRREIPGIFRALFGRCDANSDIVSVSIKQAFYQSSTALSGITEQFSSTHRTGSNYSTCRITKVFPPRRGTTSTFYNLSSSSYYKPNRGHINAVLL